MDESDNMHEFVYDSRVIDALVGQRHLLCSAYLRKVRVTSEQMLNNELEETDPSSLAMVT